MENRSGVKAKRLRALIVDRHAQHVGGQQVARELNARVIEPECLRERLRKRRLAHTRNVLDQQMSARQKAGKRDPQRLRFSDDNAGELLQHRGKTLRDGNRRLRNWTNSHEPSVTFMSEYSRL